MTSEEPSIAEIAALTSRLRHLSSPAATEAERAAFIADKNALLARIAGYTEATDDHTEPPERRAAVAPVVAEAQATAQDDADAVRAEQLCRWHTDDQAEAGADDDAQDDPGWSK